jgi:hypothetical protein
LAFEEGLPEGPDQDMIEIPQGLRSVNQRLQEVLGRDPNMREVLAGIQRERELDRPLSVTEINDLLRELSDLELRDRLRNVTFEQNSEYFPGVPPEQQHLAPTIAEARALVHGGFFTRPTEPAEPVTIPSSRTPMGGVSLDDYNNNHPLSRLNEDLTALGFPPESISIERSIEGGTSLTIHMPMTMQTQLTGPGHSSVTFILG